MYKIPYRRNESTFNQVVGFEEPKKKFGRRLPRKQVRRISLFARTKEARDGIELLRLNFHFSGGDAYYCPLYCEAIVWDGTGKLEGHEQLRGKGSAGGCGYDRQSAAAQRALEDMGLKFKRDFDGVGEGATLQALFAVGRYLGYRSSQMFVVVFDSLG
jgi:hypothetical protein